MPTDPTGPDHSVYYHHDNPDDPFLDDQDRTPNAEDWWPCYACDCTNNLESGCRCSCHAQRRHH